MEQAGCRKVFQEALSSVATSRPQLQAALEWVRDGDVLVVTKLDRLARSIADLVAITTALKTKRVGLRILSMHLDTETPTGTLMINLLGSIAEFERELMLERQREGIAKAKVDGKYQGRQPTARRKTVDVLRLRREGKSASDIVKALGNQPSKRFSYHCRERIGLRPCGSVAHRNVRFAPRSGRRCLQLLVAGLGRKPTVSFWRLEGDSGHLAMP